MKRILQLGLMLSCFTCHVEAQKVDSQRIIDSIKAAITRFFIKESLLNKTKVKEDLNHVFVTEIKQKRAVGYDLNGIYRIGVYQSHSPEHILIKQNSEFTIFHLDEIDTVLTEVIAYSRKKSISTDIMLQYVSAIIDMYKEGSNHNHAARKVKKQ